jgi:hypothetical protein
VDRGGESVLQPYKQLQEEKERNSTKIQVAKPMFEPV